MSWNAWCSKCVCNYDRTLLSIHRLRGCPNAAKQQLVNATGRKWSIAWRLAGEQKKGASLPQHPISTSFSFTLLDYLILVCKVHPFRATPTQAQASVPEVAPGELQVDLDEISESENRFWLRERVFFRMGLWTTQIDALSTLIGKWHFHQTVDMFEGY